ncbi:collagen alpha-1(XII) chain-like [Acropora palmata]|uniref:collagen alpha-1(XII) chain-like n=1 Tax=Acropora palmata TaxID=6131 RepID=UPI003DA12F27
MFVKVIWVSQVYRSLVCRLLFAAFVTAASTTDFELNETEEATNVVGPEINGTQEVSNLMDQLFDDNQACSIPVMELGFLVSDSYDQRSGVMERDFRKTLKFVKETAEHIKISDLGTHVGLVVYGKKPLMAFDFNEYFNIKRLSEAIEDVQTPDDGNNVGAALLFAKKQLFDKSARTGIPKALIVLLTKKSEDELQPGIDALREAGVNIFTVGIEAKTDPMEMNDIASDVKNTFFTDYDHLGSLATKLAPQLCQAPIEPAIHSNDDNKQMKPEEEPGAATAHVNNVNVTSPGIPSQGNKETPMKDAPRPKKETDDQGRKMTQNTAGDENNYQDSVSVSGLTDEDAASKESADETSGVDSGNSGSSSGDDTPTDDDNTRDDAEISIHTFDDSSEKHEGSHGDSTLAAVSRGKVVTKKNVKKTCFAKADIGILIDGSSSIKEEQFFKLLNFTTSLVDLFSVSKDRAHIAVATASKGPQMSFDFQGFQDSTGLKTAISRMAFDGGPYLLGSSLTGLKTTWFKNSGRTSIPQLLLVLATTSSGDDIVAPSRVLRDRGVRIESVGIGPHFDGTQLKEIATHPAKDHVMAVSKFELLPLIRPLLTFRMCRAVGGKLIQSSSPEIHDGQPGKSTSASSSKERIDPKAQHLPTIKITQHDTEYRSEQETETEEAYLESQMEQLEKQRQNESDDSYQKDGIEKAKVREGIRRKLYAWLRRLGRSKKDIRAAYRSFIFNINGHHDSVNCMDRHDLCKQWARDNLCERENDTMDPQSVQRVCPRSCQICVR